MIWGDLGGLDFEFKIVQVCASSCKFGKFRASLRKFRASLGTVLVLASKFGDGSCSQVWGRFLFLPFTGLYIFHY